MEFESEKILLNHVLAQKKESFDVEDNIIIPDIKPDVLSIVNSCGNVYVYKKEINNGKLKLDGGVQIDVMYLADDEKNNLRAVHSNLDFSKNIDIDGIDNCSDFSCSLKIKNIEPKILNGRKVSLKVSFDANVTIFFNEEKEYIKSVADTSNIQMISNTIKINSMTGCGETISSAKDTINVNDNLADILSTNMFVKNKEVKISYNKVLSKADVVVNILYITEDEQVKTVKTEIPVMGFIDIAGISDNEICDTDYEFRNINIKPNNVEDHSIYVETELLIKCKSYATKEINLIQDLYSPDNDIVINQDSVSVIENKNIMTDLQCIKEKISIPELKDNLVYDINVTPNIVKQNNMNNSISYECELQVTILYQSSITNRIETKSQTIDFSKEVECLEINKNSVVNTMIEPETIEFSCSGNNVLDLNVNINFTIDSCNNSIVDMVSNIKAENSEQSDRGYSLVIYYVKSGDTLWKIAKKFRSTIDEIAQINGIENVDKINRGDQLFIPRYVSGKI
ncbi:MAG: DUF3794 domain-containing protein [Clostridia bacterium]|nr:DUF3794 domain-containing protein [Clostridia bacterium]